MNLGDGSWNCLGDCTACLCLDLLYWDVRLDIEFLDLDLLELDMVGFLVDDL